MLKATSLNQIDHIMTCHDMSSNVTMLTLEPYLKTRPLGKVISSTLPFSLVDLCIAPCRWGSHPDSHGQKLMNYRGPKYFFSGGVRWIWMIAIPQCTPWRTNPNCSTMRTNWQNKILLNLTVSFELYDGYFIQFLIFCRFYRVVIVSCTTSRPHFMTISAVLSFLCFYGLAII